MSVVQAFCVGLGLCHLAIARHGVYRRNLRLRLPWRRFDGRVGVIMPVRGDSPTLRDTLARIATQQQVDYRLVVVTESETDSAVAAILESSTLHFRIEHAVAGFSHGCSQKNHNLLAGLRIVAPAEVYVTVDADVLPSADWLRRMVAPFVDPEVDITTTHHLPGTAGSRGWSAVTAATLVRYLGCVAALPQLMIIWGGGTALRAKCFESLGLDRLWRETVVDDVSIGPWAVRHGLRRVFCSEALIPSPNPGFDWEGLYRWTLRQVQFARHCDPLAWATGLCATLPIALMMAALPLGIPLTMLGLVPAAVPFAGALTTLLVLAMGPCLARLDRRPTCGAFRHAVGMVLTAFLLSAAVIHAGVGHTIIWGERRYHLRRGGRVRAIEWLREAPDADLPKV
jgi:ceramide glucosyltransferase